MELRDEIAIEYMKAALQPAFAKPLTANQVAHLNTDLPVLAYDMADRMMEERGKQGNVGW